MKISPEIVQLFKRLDKIYKHREKTKAIDNAIEVDAITSHLASLYEKLRNSMDFKEVHLLRRYSIERNLRRRFIMEVLKPQIARAVIEELIRAKYLPNAQIPEEKVAEVELIIEKYNRLFSLMNEMYTGEQSKRYFEWLVGIEAVEIDMCLHPEDDADAVIEAMYEMTKHRIKLRGDDVSIREKNIQLYIAIHRALVKSDDPIISYHLLNLYFPDWHKANQELIKLLAAKLPDVFKAAQKQLRHPHQRKISLALREQTVTWSIFYELIQIKGPEIEDLLVNPQRLESEAKLFIGQKYKKFRKRLRGSSVRAIIYIFVTKVLLALLLEVPYELAAEAVNYVNLGINILFPPFLMFLVTLSILPPSDENTKKILENLHNIVYNESSQSILCELKSKYRQSTGFRFIYYLLYSLLYVIVFGAIIYLLRRLDFNIVSGAIFIFFLTAVSFFAIKIRATAKELVVIQRREGVISFVVKFFSLPIIGVGRWLSTKFRHINVFAFVMDYIIEAPFKMILLVMEHWFGFIKEKREEVYHDRE